LVSFLSILIFCKNTIFFCNYLFFAKKTLTLQKIIFYLKHHILMKKIYLIFTIFAGFFLFSCEQVPLPCDCGDETDKIELIKTASDSGYASSDLQFTP